jgi:bacillithiol biosynthesis cysteine-adding enzyme BshC
VAELRRQNEALPASEGRRGNLSKLEDPRVGAVVTGQQVGLFLGPAFGFYKAATAIAHAKGHDAPTVPIFWLQSEDHDADEVASCGVLDAGGALSSVSLRPSGPDRSSMAHRQLGPDVGRALDDLAARLEGSAHGAACVASLRRAYRAGAGWVEAFATALAEVFEDLLFLDPRTPAVAELARPVHRRALEDVAGLDRALAARSAELEHQGLAVPVRPRPGCSLSFYHPDGAAGPRFRLERVAGGWQRPGAGRISERELFDQLDHDPLRFSTSTLLRVVLQDTLLPTVAYVAGPGEARYLPQAAALHQVYGVPEPAVVPRARFVVTDARTRRDLDALGVGATAVEGDVLARLAARDGGLSGADLEARVVAAVERELAVLDAPDLAGARERTRRHVARGAAALAARIDRVRARRDHVRVERVERVCRQLRPGGQPQERALAFPHFASRHGLEVWKSAVLAALEQPASGLRELAL